MTAANPSEVSWIYQDGPSREDIETQSQYSKTRSYYGFLMEKGRMLQLQSLEKPPAPVACPHCQKPVITTVKIERTGAQWFSIIFMTIISIGIMTYPMVTRERTFVHLCPSCGSRIALLANTLTGGLSIRVFGSYDYEDGKSAQSLYGTINMHGSVYYQWNNNNSKIGTQAVRIDEQHQKNEFRADSVQNG